LCISLTGRFERESDDTDTGLDAIAAVKSEHIDNSLI